MPKAGTVRSSIFRDGHSGKPNVLALLQQPRANEQHRTFCASWCSFVIFDKARGTLELAKTAVQLDPVDSRAHLCCGWSYVTALRESEAAPHMDLACELNDNDPWTLLSCAHYCAFCGSIEQARLRAQQSLALSLAPSYLEWGYHGIIRVLCGDYAGALEADDRAEEVIKTLPAWRAAALFHLGEPGQAREQARRFLNVIRSFWVGSCPQR